MASRSNQTRESDQNIFSTQGKALHETESKKEQWRENELQDLIYKNFLTEDRANFVSLLEQMKVLMPEIDDEISENLEKIKEEMMNRNAMLNVIRTKSHADSITAFSSEDRMITPISDKLLEIDKFNDIEEYPSTVMLADKFEIIKKNIDVLVQLRGEVNKAISRQKIFTIIGNEDTVRNELLDRGWIEKFDNSYFDTIPSSQKYLVYMNVFELLNALNSNYNRDNIELTEILIKSKLLETTNVNLYWGPLDKIDDLSAFEKIPYVNSFYAIDFTSKKLLTENQSKMHWYQTDKYKLILPRTYFCNTEGLSDFFQDYRLTAAMSLLKWIVNVKQGKGVICMNGKIPLSVFDFACGECLKYVSKCRHEDIDESIPEKTTLDWEEFLKYYYEATRLNHTFKERSPNNDETLYRKALRLLTLVKNYHGPYEQDGYMNLWVLKPIFNNFNKKDTNIFDNMKFLKILNDQSKTTKYIIQKYIENPLLIERTKFSIHHFFLISKQNPLTIWMYTDGYIHFCSSFFDLTKVHNLTVVENSIVKKRPVPQKKGPSSKRIPSYKMWSLDTFFNHLQKQQNKEIYNKKIRPMIKQSFIAAIIMNDFEEDTRIKPFQLLGVEYAIDEEYTPWMVDIYKNPTAREVTPVNQYLFNKMNEDAIKVVIDWAENNRASTGSFELIYQETPTILPEPETLMLRGKPVKSMITEMPTYEALTNIKKVKPEVEKPTDTKDKIVENKKEIKATSKKTIAAKEQKTIKPSTIIAKRETKSDNISRNVTNIKRPPIRIKGRTKSTKVESGLKAKEKAVSNNVPGIPKTE